MYGGANKGAGRVPSVRGVLASLATPKEARCMRVSSALKVLRKKKKGGDGHGECQNCG